jgi:hypothetical protein
MMIVMAIVMMIMMMIIYVKYNGQIYDMMVERVKNNDKIQNSRINRQVN